MGKQDLPAGVLPAEIAIADEGSKTIALLQTKTIDVYSDVAKALPGLRTKYQNAAFAVGTATGMAEAKAARIALREPRYAVDKAVKSGKDMLNILKRTLDSQALALTNSLVDLETPIHEQIKAEEDRVVAEREAAKQAKAAAAAQAQNTIDGIRSMAVKAATMSAAGIDALRAELDATELLNEVLGERTGEALQAKMQTLETLDSLHGAAIKREADAAQAAADRAELDKMRAERAERERKEVADRQAIEQAAQAERDEATQLAEKTLADDRAAFAKEMADARAAQGAEDTRLALQREELDRAAKAEQQRQADLIAADQKKKDDLAEAERAEAARVAEEARAEQARQDEEVRQAEATHRAELQRLADEAAALARAKADQMAAEKRAADEAAHQADQRGRDAWRVLLAALMLLRDNNALTDPESIAQVDAAIELATGEKV